MHEVIPLFPTPLLRCEGLVDASLVAQLRSHLQALITVPNAKSAKLSHSQILQPEGDALLQSLTDRLMPAIVELGEQLFGQALPWRIKELWGNVLQTGGHQAIHNHANSFVSGIVYLSVSDASARTAFSRGLGGRDFAFSNTNRQAQTGPYNAEKWLAPEPAPVDVLLFPSYLLHEVPFNQGPERISMAFNAIPERLDAWGYSIGFH